MNLVKFLLEDFVTWNHINLHIGIRQKNAMTKGRGLVQV